MKKIKLLIELEYDDEIMHGDDDEAYDWFMNTILLKEELLLHSNELGDHVGSVKVLEIFK